MQKEMQFCTQQYRLLVTHLVQDYSNGRPDYDPLGIFLSD
jgi:hypothetical protein